MIQCGAEQPRHVHQSAEQIWIATKGTGSLLLADEKEMSFEQGDVVRFADGIFMY
ncbi:MAG: cupin domain-containing protein [Treponema sp.]|nr:cupin domain-containing protein [Treponema sp.]